EFGGVRTEPFRIARDVYADNVWQPSLDTYLPVQMDHVLVRDAYRVWHGASHLDDARQAPVNHQHFDLYAQGPTTDSRYRPGEHIPGLNVGGWFDAGDYDIRTQTQYATVENLALAYETFHLDRDETTVQEENRWVDLHHPDGVPDVLQQVEHGVLGLLAQYRAFDHAIPGIISPTLPQYRHLGDALTMTDNLVYDAALDSLQSDGTRSGTSDDRWAFTSRSTPLDYGSVAALAAAARVLHGHDDALADTCLRTATRVWAREQGRAPVIFRSGNTTGGPLEAEETKAAVELLVTTGGGKQYADRLNALWPYVEAHFDQLGALAARAIPYMDAAFARKVEAATRAYKTRTDAELARNPFGVPISGGGWGGSGLALRFAMDGYILHRAFPRIIGPEYTLRGLDYVLGTHPASDVSMVSGVGARSKTIAYGSNRADFTFIPGGIVPGVVIVKPDYPELKEDWPFLWYEGEYVVGQAPLLIYVANAANSLLN
ncbi:MAG TPA: glycoside hydrolase family 9 protein, partial [Longimicrobiaceae bacterium]|nr:glycoside hydrolase family 9 protein [Longimicrobiaceae bacterium]